MVAGCPGGLGSSRKVRSSEWREEEKTESGASAKVFLRHSKPPRVLSGATEESEGTMSQGR
jgi:hypothetical protein